MRMKTAVGQALRTTAMTVLIAVSIPAMPAGAQRQPTPSGVKVGAQIATGTLVAPVAFVAGGLGTKWVARHLGADEARESRLAYFGAWTLTGLATAGVPPLIVKGGNYPSALAGTVVGGAAATAMVAAGRVMFHNQEHCGVICTTWGIATFALPATGATLGYNRSR